MRSIGNGSHLCSMAGMGSPETVSLRSGRLTIPSPLPRLEESRRENGGAAHHTRIWSAELDSFFLLSRQCLRRRQPPGSCTLAGDLA